MTLFVSQPLVGSLLRSLTLLQLNCFFSCEFQGILILRSIMSNGANCLSLPHALTPIC